MSTKICTKCSVEKPLTEYYKHPETKDGYNKKCKGCFKLYHQDNRERQLAKMKQRSIEKKDEIKIKNKQYYLENKNQIKSKVKNWQKNNKQKIREIQRSYEPQYNQKYPERRLWRNLLYRVLGVNGNPKTNSTYKMLGYTHEELKIHLDKQGINWDKDNVDHKIPITWFKSNTPPSLVNALDNLHPLTEQQNKTKSNKFCSPTPSSYIIKIKSYIKEKYIPKLLYL